MESKQIRTLAELYKQSEEDMVKLHDIDRTIIPKLKEVLNAKKNSFIK